MRARELEFKLAKLLDCPAGQIDQRMRPLRELGIIPVGGHGLNAPDIRPEHAACMLLQLVSLRTVEASRIGMQAMNLEYVPVPGVADAFFGYRDQNRLTLGAALAFLITDPTQAWHRVEIACDGSRAWLMISHHGQPLELLFDGDAEFAAKCIDGELTRYRNQGTAFFGHRLVMGAGQVKQVALWIRETEEGERLKPTQPDPSVEQFRAMLAASNIHVTNDLELVH